MQALWTCLLLCPLTVTADALISSGASVQASEAFVEYEYEVQKNPIRRVVTLLQNMAKKVEADGEKEKDLYDKFMCYCKNGAKDLEAAISSNDAKIPQVQSEIEGSTAAKTQAEADLKQHQTDRAAAKDAMAQATAVREKEHATFSATEGEYKTYLSALGKAIPAIEKGMSGGGFLQTELGEAGPLVRKAASADNDLTDYDRQAVLVFLAGSSSDSQGDGYSPKSGEITGILKTIQEDYQKQLDDLEATEKSALQTYEELMAAKAKEVEALTAAIEKKTVRIGELGVSIANMKTELTDAEATLIEDQKFLKDMDKLCAEKVKEWDIRVKMRSEELLAIQETIKILNDDDALELFKKTLPAAGSLLQFKVHQQADRKKALEILQGINKKARQMHPKLDFIAMALNGKKADFSKIIKMIDDMVALLKQEQFDDDSKKEYCEKQLDFVEDKSKELSSKITDLETTIADADETMTALKAEIEELSDGIAELDKSVAEATDQRKKEHEEYSELMAGNTAAKELLGYAKNRLNKFYNPDQYKEPEEPAEEEFLQVKKGPNFMQVNAHHQREKPDAPPPEFGDYGKKTGESNSVIAMVDQIIADLDKEMTEADAEEKNAQKEYEELMSDSADKREKDRKLILAKEKAVSDALDEKTTSEATKKEETKELMATEEYKTSLHGECDWLMETFGLRKEARTNELEALKEAKAVLSGADFSLVQGKKKQDPAAREAMLNRRLMR